MILTGALSSVAVVIAWTIVSLKISRDSRSVILERAGSLIRSESWYFFSSMVLMSIIVLRLDLKVGAVSSDVEKRIGI